jgi:hypothetical protein
VGVYVDRLHVDVAVGLFILVEGCRMARDFHIKYAKRVALLIPRDPKKWKPIWVFHMKQFLRS